VTDGGRGLLYGGVIVMCGHISPAILPGLTGVAVGLVRRIPRPTAHYDFGAVLAVYSDERMNWSIFGWTAPSSRIGSIEPVWIIALSPAFAVMWTKLGCRAPTTPRKFAYGVIGMGLAFLLFMAMAGTAGRSVPVLFVVAVMGAFAVSELLLSPIGLSVT